MKIHRILAIDPGSERSAWVVLESGVVAGHGRLSNEELLLELRLGVLGASAHTVVIEQIESYGMAVGRDVFETVWWSGRFAEAAAPTPVARLPRRAVKLGLCGSSAAKDANVRQALIDRFGDVGGRGAAIGTKAAPGPLYGIANDEWSALAVAVVWAEQQARAAA